MPYTDGELTFYLYGEEGAPAGDGSGGQEFATIVDAARASGKPFEDPYFLADNSALDGIPLQYAGGESMDVKWMRPHEIAKQLFNAEPIFARLYNEFGVNQGMVGDCWFLAVLADVSLQPGCINTLVPLDNKEVGFDSGAFHFRFWCRAKWLDVVVDDRLPCVMDDDGTISDTVFCKPTADGGFWAPLLEKAYAKMYTKYANISAGEPADAMIDFTGGFLQSYSTPDKDANIPNFVQLVREGIADNAIIAAGTVDNPPTGKESIPDPDNPGQEDVSSDGVVCGHAYSVLGTQDVPLKDDPAQVVTLIKMRNPWGNNAEWKGNYSDSDDQGWATLSKDLRRKTAKSADRLEDGEFWVTYDSIREYISDLDICRWTGKYRGTEPFSHKDGASIFMDLGKFTPENSGGDVSTDTVQNKKGYYAHLKPINPDGGEEKDGLRYNCSVTVDMIYLNYTKSGDNPDIPLFGYNLLWAPGECKPEGDFFDNVNSDLFKIELIDKERRLTNRYELPSGTIYVVPWTQDPDEKEPPFFIRIAVEGDVMPYP